MLSPKHRLSFSCSAGGFKSELGVGGLCLAFPGMFSFLLSPARQGWVQEVLGGLGVALLTPPVLPELWGGAAPEGMLREENVLKASQSWGSSQAGQNAALLSPWALQEHGKSRAATRGSGGSPLHIAAGFFAVFVSVQGLSLGRTERQHSGMFSRLAG